MKDEKPEERRWLTKSLEKSAYEQLKLPKRKKQVSLFVAQDKENKFKTEDESQENKDVFLARLNFDNLGLTNRTLFHLGCLSTLYVSSPRSGVGSVHSSAASATSVC